VLLLVDEHTRSANPYRLLYAALGIDEPEDPRTKPSCCDAEGQPPIDPALIERFERGLRDLGRTLPAGVSAPSRRRRSPLVHHATVICPEGRPQDIRDGCDSARTSQTSSRGSAAGSGADGRRYRRRTRRPVPSRSHDLRDVPGTAAVHRDPHGDPGGAPHQRTPAVGAG
jgi:hypothetical protein